VPDAPRYGRPAEQPWIGEHFLAEHAPLQESGPGTVIVEARRHFLDVAEMTPAESAELGSVLHRLVPAVKAATGVQRVYFLAVMERAPQQPPLTASRSAAAAMPGGTGAGAPDPRSLSVAI
jgi:diadenosine tetraphosphate (Ap4A) HIT family hydrolase